MKYIKHIVLMAFVMVMTANVWGMDIYIHFSNGTWPTGIPSSNFNSDGDFIISDLSPAESIQYLKSKIEDRTGFNPIGMKLSYGTYEDLADNQTLSDYSITQNGTTLTLTYTDPTQPQRVTNNNWRVQTMPRGNRVLRTLWKQDPQLAWKVGEETITVESNPLVAYVGFPFTGATLSVVDDDILGDVIYSIVPKVGTNSGNTIDEDGVVTINGTGIDTVKAIFAGTDDYLSDTAMYIIESRDPYMLTLATTGSGTLELAPTSYTLTFAGNNSNNYVVNDYDGTSYSIELLSLLNTLYGATDYHDLDSDKEHISWSVPNLVVTGTFAASETYTVNKQLSVSSQFPITVTCTPNMVVVDNGDGSYYVPYNSNVKVIATPETNNYLVSWTKQVGTEDAASIDGAPSIAAVNTTFAVNANTEVSATFAPFPKLTVEKEGVGSVEVVSVTRTAQSESINTTVSGYNTFSGTLFTVNSQTYASNGKGFTIGHLADETISESLSATITANNNQTIIDSVKIARQQTQTPYNCSFADMTVDRGTYTYSDDTATIRGVNATNLTIGIQNEWDNSSLWISTVKVFYTNITAVATVDYVVTNDGYVYTIEPGTEVQLTATAGANYHFDNWSWGTGSNAQTTNNPIYVTMPNDGTANVTRKATFAIDTYTITATANNSNMGIVTGGNTYEHGTPVTLTATPNTGYHFVNWTKAGAEVSTEATYDFTATAATAGEYIANFAQTPVLKLVANGNGTVDTVGTIAGVTIKDANAKEYYVIPGTEVIVKATPAENHYLASWSNGATVNEFDTIHVTVTKDSSITANFVSHPVLTLAIVGNGSVELVGNGLGISQLSIPSSWHNDESPLTVADMPGFEPTTLQQAQAMSGIPSTGKVAIIYDINNTAAYIAIFENGHVFAQMPNSITSLTHDGCEYGKTENNIQFYYVSSVLPDGITVKNEDNGEYYVASGTEVIVKATPAENYNFTSWDPTRENPEDTMHITVTEDTTVTATFTAYPTLKLVADGNGSIKLGGIFQLDIPSFWEGDNTTLLTAADMPGFTSITPEQIQAMTDIPASGYVVLVYDIDNQGTSHFAIFLGGNLINVSSNNVSHNACYNAAREFGAQFYYATSDLSGYVAIKNAANGEYYVKPGTEVNIQAVPAENHHFSSWSDVEGTVLTRSITVTEDSIITATFTVNPTLTLVAEGNGTVTLDGYVPAESESVLLAELTGDEHDINNEGKVFVLIRSDHGTKSYGSDNGIIPGNSDTELSITITDGIGYAIDSVTFELKTPSNATCKLTQAPYVLWVTQDEYNNGYGTYSAAGRQGIYYGQQGPTSVKIWGHATSILPAGVTEYTVNDEVVDGKFYVTPSTEVTVIATPKTNNYFKNWNDEGAINSNEAVTTTFTVTEDTTLTAHFEAKPTLTLEADGTGTVVAGLKYFSISSNQQVYFAKGNLQHVDNSWQFAEHQYDYFGENQTNGSDMFGFNQYTCPDGWYCLSREQWDSILNIRTTNNSLFNGARYTLATVNNVKGMIIFPDNYIHPSNTGFVAGTYNAPSNYTATVGLEGWEMMEAAGCVFLPSAGFHKDGNIGWYHVGTDGNYMSTTNHLGTTVYNNKYFAIYFKSDHVTVDDFLDNTSLTSVRLVSNTSPQQEVIVDNHDGTYTVNYGTTVTVMAIPAANHYFKNWNNEAVINSDEVVTTTFTVTEDTTLTAHFIPATKGVTPEGEITNSGDFFVSETGEVVGLPRVTETGEIIDYSGSTEPTQTLSYITVSKGNTGLSGDKRFYYAPGDTYKDAVNRPENKLPENRGWFYWEGDNDATIYYKEESGLQKDMSIDGDQHLGPLLNSEVNPTGHTYIFVNQF
jgi:hypothetical protein